MEKSEFRSFSKVSFVFVTSSNPFFRFWNIFKISSIFFSNFDRFLTNIFDFRKIWTSRFFNLFQKRRWFVIIIGYLARIQPNSLNILINLGQFCILGHSFGSIFYIFVGWNFWPKIFIFGQFSVIFCVKITSSYFWMAETRFFFR